MKEVIILAGGLGTRLRSAVPDLPKCMAPVRGRPFLSYLIDYFEAQGISRFIFSLGYKQEVITAFLETAYPGLEYTCSVETEPLGTGGAIRLACSRAWEENVLIANGDTMFKVDAAALGAFHGAHGADVTLCLKHMEDFDRYGAVDLHEDGRIRRFEEKKHYGEGLINGGIYALRTSALLELDFPPVFSFEQAYLERYAGSRPIYGLVQDGYFIDIGIPEDYNKAQVEL
jgi:D-glycero-alpha-D-manno-heptose 1-phosphate guanylyltransferase